MSYRKHRVQGQHRSVVPASMTLLTPCIALIDLCWIPALALLTGVLYDVTTIAGFSAAQNNLGSGMAVAILYSAFAHLAKLYEASNLLRLAWQIGRSLIVWIAVFAFMATLLFLLKMGTAYSRGWVLLFFASGLLTTAAVRILVVMGLAYIIRAQLIRPHRVVVVGVAEELAGNSALQDLEAYGYEIAETVTLTIGPGRVFDEVLVRQRMREIVVNIRQSMVDEVIVAVPWQFVEAIGQVERELQILPIPIKLLPDRLSGGLLDRPLSDLGPTRAVQLQRAPLSAAQRVLKRSIDQVLATAALAILWPLFAIVGIAIRLESPGRALFLQTRVGFNGRPFLIYKFRTMNARDDGPVVVQAKKNDKRITKIGALLRKLSIDEIPQLINVLRGEMSLVGPRPHALSHDNEYDRLIATYAIRHKIKPGITGWAQVNGFRGETPELRMMEQRVKSDLWYIESWSFWLDIRILAMTVVSVLRTKNAH